MLNGSQMNKVIINFSNGYSQEFTCDKVELDYILTFLDKEGLQFYHITGPNKSFIFNRALITFIEIIPIQQEKNEDLSTSGH